MATLAQATRESRLILKLLGISFSVVALIFILIWGGGFLKQLFFPSPPPIPKQAFGKLPEIPFEQKNIDIKFKINTVTGRLPDFPDRMNIYKIEASSPSLSSLKEAREKVARLGLSQSETKLSNSIYSWRDRRGSSISYNIFSNNFRYVTPITESVSAPSTDDAFSSVLTFLTNIGADASDIEQEKTAFSFYTFNNGQFREVDSQSQAFYTRVDLFQKDIDGYEIFYPGMNISIMHFTVNGSERIVEAEYNHLAADNNASSDYPIISASDAFKKLENGNALIYNNSSEKEIDITSVSLGYYLGDADQKYTLPIAVFEGKNFKAYVQILPDTSLLKAESN